MNTYKLYFQFYHHYTDNNEVWGYEAGYDILCDHDMILDVVPLGGGAPHK